MTDRTPRFEQLNIISDDPSASIEFYRRLGLVIAETSIWRTHSGIHHVGIRAASATDGADLDIDSVAFARIWNSGWQGRENLRGRVVAGFGVTSREEVDERYRELTSAGYRGLQPPYDALWGARYAIVEDPDGLAVGLMSPVSPDRRAAPPEL